ncbi:FAD-dependent oxidoreductase [Fodinicola acaciae]|uniref:FAD-dependent oxidoreductase n=1 Tax=Fodinicola acaciae TaxID=2681555 RepID=UPI0013D2EC76|nr:NAD(P)/FAD-dependent oxidoreductase [Fodinicola acaciae]
MATNSPRIIIAGAGIGGLALAHALRREGMDVVVYERDEVVRTAGVAGGSARARNQGYRIHIDMNGNAALEACLPPEVFELARRTSAGSRYNSGLVAGYTHQLQRVMAQEFPGVSDGSEPPIFAVDRYAFRKALLTGLDDTIHFGRTLTGYQVDSGRVRVNFADGSSDEGDLLVGADGVGSAVRRQMLPDATQKDLGVRCIYGRMPLNETTDKLVPEDFDRGFSWVADETGYGTAFGTVRFRTPVEGATDYLMTVLTATPKRLGLTDDALFQLSPEELWKITLEATSDWHQTVRDFFGNADPESFFPITIRAAERVSPWQPGPVTLLGDAIHVMPPTGGVGANTALRDAQTLAEQLVLVGHGEKALVEAVGDYESVMLPRGFETVEASLRMAGEYFGEE